ncbi:MAG: hypothetical protein QXY62_03015 [Candidatus Altiarchaeota archaeon]
MQTESKGKLLFIEKLIFIFLIIIVFSFIITQVSAKVTECFEGETNGCCDCINNVWKPYDSNCKGPDAGKKCVKEGSNCVCKLDSDCTKSGGTCKYGKAACETHCNSLQKELDKWITTSKECEGMGFAGCCYCKDKEPAKDCQIAGGTCVVGDASECQSYCKSKNKNFKNCYYGKAECSGECCCICEDKPAQECTPGEKKCDGDNLKECGADGKWTTKTCPYGCDATKKECKSGEPSTICSLRGSCNECLSDSKCAWCTSGISKCKELLKCNDDCPGECIYSLSKCGGQPEQYHLECIENKCKKVSGAGINTCNKEGESCGTTCKENGRRCSSDSECCSGYCGKSDTEPENVCKEKPSSPCNTLTHPTCELCVSEQKADCYWNPSTSTCWLKGEGDCKDITKCYKNCADAYPCATQTHPTCALCLGETKAKCLWRPSDKTCWKKENCISGCVDYCCSDSDCPQPKPTCPFAVGAICYYGGQAKCVEGAPIIASNWFSELIRWFYSLFSPGIKVCGWECDKKDTNKQCDLSVCTNSGWDNSKCGGPGSTTPPSPTGCSKGASCQTPGAKCCDPTTNWMYECKCNFLIGRPSYEPSYGYRYLYTSERISTGRGFVSIFEYEFEKKAREELNKNRNLTDEQKEKILSAYRLKIIEMGEPYSLLEVGTIAEPNPLCKLACDEAKKLAYKACDEGKKLCNEACDKIVCDPNDWFCNFVTKPACYLGCEGTKVACYAAADAAHKKCLELCEGAPCDTGKGHETCEKCVAETKAKCLWRKSDNTCWEASKCTSNDCTDSCTTTPTVPPGGCSQGATCQNEGEYCCAGNAMYQCQCTSQDFLLQAVGPVGRISQDIFALSDAKSCLAECKYRGYFESLCHTSEKCPEGYVEARIPGGGLCETGKYCCCKKVDVSACEKSGTTCKDPSGTYKDECKDTKTVYSWYCYLGKCEKGTLTCGENQKCENGVCITVGATHLECKNNICTKVSGAGQDQCSPEGSSCGGQGTCSISADPTNLKFPDSGGWVGSKITVYYSGYGATTAVVDCGNGQNVYPNCGSGKCETTCRYYSKGTFKVTATLQGGVGTPPNCGSVTITVDGVPPTQCPLKLDSIKVDTSAKVSVTFEAIGQGIEQINVHIYSSGGAEIFTSGWQNGNKYTWNLKDNKGNPVDPGVYLYKVEVKGCNEAKESKIEKFVVEVKVCKYQKCDGKNEVGCKCGNVFTGGSALWCCNNEPITSFVAPSKENCLANCEETHLECKNNICTKVSGAGQDQCSPEGSSCGGPPPKKCVWEKFKDCDQGCCGNLCCGLSCSWSEKMYCSQGCCGDTCCGVTPPTTPPGVTTTPTTPPGVTTTTLPFNCPPWSCEDILKDSQLLQAVLKYDTNKDGKIDANEGNNAIKDYMIYFKITLNQACAVVLFWKLGCSLTGCTEGGICYTPGATCCDPATGNKYKCEGTGPTPTKCQSDADCNPCQKCENGQCVTKCKPNEVCINGQCVSAKACQNDNDCNTNNCEKCDSGNCVSKCKPGEICQNGKCVSGPGGASCSISVSPQNPQVNEKIKIIVDYQNMDPQDKYFYIHSGYNQATSVGPCKGESGSCSLDNQFSYPTPGTYKITGNLQLASPAVLCSPTNVVVGGGISTEISTTTIPSPTQTTTTTVQTGPCTDSDGGINYYEKGVTKRVVGAYKEQNTDYCHYYDLMVREFYCNQAGFIVHMDHSCSLDPPYTKCVDGRCI